VRVRVARDRERVAKSEGFKRSCIINRSGGNRERSAEVENVQFLGFCRLLKIKSSDRLPRTLGRDRERSTLWSKFQKSRRAASSLPRTLSRDREHSIPWFLLDLFAPGSGVGSKPQTRSECWPVSEVKIFLERLSFYVIKKFIRSRSSRVSWFRPSFVFPTRRG